MWIVISGILGILGFIISAINLIHYFVSHSVNLEITVLEYKLKEYTNGNVLMQVQYMLSNKSQLPISITNMEMVVNDKLYPTERRTHTLDIYYYKVNGQTVDRNPIYNSYTPINLESLGSTLGDFVYILPPEVEPDYRNGMLFEISTNRSQAVRKKLVPKVPFVISHRKTPRANIQNH